MFIKTTFNSDLNHILNCVNKCDFGTKCFAKVEHFVLRLIIGSGTIVNDYHFITDREYSGCPRVDKFAGVVKTVIVHGDDG